MQALIKALGDICCEVDGKPASLVQGVAAVSRLLDEAAGRGGMCWLFGNGGSGAIADHIACDLTLYGRRAIALTNPAMTTTMANDFGLEHAFSKQLQRLARPDDVLIGMSCSGESLNVLFGLTAAPCPTSWVTLSGFAPDNTLNAVTPDVGFWVPSNDYGVVQIAHLAILHAVADAARIAQ